MAGRPTPKPKASRLPKFVGTIAERQPALWRAYEALGKAAATAGPLTPREQRLVKLALAIGAGSEGSCHSHTRRALAERLSIDALEHVAFLAITSLGWSQAMRGLSWIGDVTRAK